MNAKPRSRLKASASEMLTCGYVYFFHNPATGLTKIGFSADPHARRKVLENEYGPLQVLGVAWSENARALEEAKSAKGFEVTLPDKP